MIVGQSKTDIPDECGDFCPIYKGHGRGPVVMYQGDSCTRCPIFCCTDHPKVGRLVEPEYYSEEYLEGYLRVWGM